MKTDKEIRKEMGNRIKILRIEKGITQKELALKLGFKGAASVSNYEDGYRIPKDYTKIKICEIFSCTMDYLYGLE